MTAALRIPPGFSNGDPSTWPETAPNLTTRTCLHCGELFHVPPSARQQCCWEPADYAIKDAVERITARGGYEEFAVSVRRALGGAWYVDLVWEDWDLDAGHRVIRREYTDHNWRRLLRGISADMSPSAQAAWWRQWRRDNALEEERTAILAAGEMAEGEART